MPLMHLMSLYDISVINDDTIDMSKIIIDIFERTIPIKKSFCKKFMIQSCSISEDKKADKKCMPPFLMCLLL